MKKEVLLNLLSDPFETCNLMNRFHGIYNELKSCLDNLLAQNRGTRECLPQAFSEQETQDIEKKNKRLGISLGISKKLSKAKVAERNVFSKYYIGNNQATSPLISPLYGDLKGLPPILINSGVNDELYEDGEKFSLKAKEAGIDITFRAGIGMIHCYPLLAPMFKEATEAMDEIVDFIKKHLRIV